MILSDTPPVRPARTRSSGARRPARPVLAEPLLPVLESFEGRWVLHFPAPVEILSANGQKNRWVTSKARREWRSTTATYLQKARLPKGLARVRIEVELHFRKRYSRRDPLNFYDYCVKPIVDACGPPRDYVLKGEPRRDPGYGVIPDDSPKYMCCQDCPHIRIGEPEPRAAFGAVTLTIIDWSKEHPS